MSTPQSTAPLSAPQSPSAPLSAPQRPSEPLSAPQSPSAPLSAPQSPSEPLRAPQRPSHCKNHAIEVSRNWHVSCIAPLRVAHAHNAPHFFPMQILLYVNYAPLLCPPNMRPYYAPLLCAPNMPP